MCCEKEQAQAVRTGAKFVTLCEKTPFHTKVVYAALSCYNHIVCVSLGGIIEL